MSASMISQHFENEVQLLEKYLLADNKEQFLKTITNNTDRKLLGLLVNPLPENYKQLCKELRIPSHLQSELKNIKLMTQLRSETADQMKHKLIDKIIKEFYKQVDFNFAQPINTISFRSEAVKQEVIQEVDKDSKLILEENLYKFIENLVGRDERKFQNLTDYGIKQLSQEFLMKLSLDNKRFLQNKITLLRTFNDQFVVKFLFNVAEQLGKMKTAPFYDQIGSTIFDSLSIQQINLMKNKNQQIMKNSSFLKKWFELNYTPKIQTKSGIYKKKKTTLSQMQKRRKILVEIRQELQKINSNFLKPYLTHLFFEILALDLKRQDPSKQLFFEFLQNLQSVSYLMNQNLRQKICQKYGNKNIKYNNAINCNDMVSQNYTVDGLISSYLVKLFKKYKNHDELIKELGKYLDFQTINRVYAEQKLSEGQQLSNGHQILTKSHLQTLKTSKQITIIEQKTQSFFKAEDDVVLALRIKNIKQIKMKIYQMDLQQYYLEDMNREIDQQINLIYLNPSVEEIVQIKGIKSPYQILEQELVIDKIQKKYGFYIVELQGEGLTSRAGIRKGAIVCFQENHIDGRLLKFYDQSGQVIENLDIWIKGKHQKITDGEYLIPFSKKNQSFTIIAVKDKYAEKINVRLTTQTYSFNVGLIYNQQSFIVGTKAKIILHPSLKLGNENISLLNMKNIKITVNLVNNLGIKSTIKYENVKFTDENDYILQIPIKSYTRSIDLLVEGQVKDIEENVVNLSFNKAINIELLQGSNNVLDFYLIRNNQGKSNILKVVGLNGESFSGLQVNLSLWYFGTHQTQNKILKTSENGEINFGTLSYVSQIKVGAMTTQGTFSRTWKFGDQIFEAAYLGNNLTYYQGESISLPIPFNWDINQQNMNSFITFVKCSSQNKRCYQNRINDITFKVIDGNEYLDISKLDNGHYELNFLKLNRTNQIIVLGGKKWKNGEIFNEENGIIYKLKSNPYQYITLGQCKEQNQNQSTKKISIPIYIPQSITDKSDLQSLRVHITLKNYHDSEDQIINGLFDFNSMNFTSNFETYELSYKKSFYFNNKTLSDEQAYVLNRANEKQFIGNNLQKPRIFLKRIQVRQTSQDQEKLENEGAYMRGPTQIGAARNCQKMMCDYAGRSLHSNNNQYYCVQFGLNSHNNYLQTSGHATFNAKYNQVIEINIPKLYNEAIVNLITSESAIRKIYYLKNQKNINKKDLRHAGLIQGNQKTGWSMSRQVYPLQKGQKKQISRDSMWCSVSLSNILQFATIKRQKIPEWVTQWRSYNNNKKLQVYDKQICNQLNIFVYYKDIQFFTKYVRPFIQNKITKTFVDLFLLDDKECLSFAHNHKINYLNEFEKILLIQRMMQHEMKNQAIELANSMQLYQKSIKRTFETYKELFDIIINSEADSAKRKMGKMDPMGERQCLLLGIPPPPSSLSCSGVFGASNRMMQPQMMMMDMAMHNQAEQIYGGGMQSISLTKKTMKRAVRKQGQKKLKAGFKQVQKTKQYTQTTYSGIKNPKQSINLIQPNLFWAKLATYLTSPKENKQFITDSFIYFNTPLEFTLASFFLPSDLNAEFQLNNKGDNFIIQANNSFLIFVKEVKQLEYADKFGVLINQRFFNPEERFTYEDDGTQIQKTVEEFIVKKPYSLQTVITNTSGTNLELQILMDIPSGSLPLLSHQYVQITNATVNAYSTVSFERVFYFPESGEYNLYPANASRNNSVIAKAKKLQKMAVKTKPSVNKLQSFNDVMRSESKKQILEYIQKRNIFDANIFSSYSILWMLNDKQFFNQVIRILRKRKYFDSMVWSFGILHKDYQTIMEYIDYNRTEGLRSLQIPIFEYFPYYSTRTHKFLNESKSTIRNIQFKQTYRNFLVSILLQNHYKSSQKIAFSYYLMLQDRIDESAIIFKTLTTEQRKAHQIQADYLDCYLSMYQDYPNFTVAQKIASQYKDYPIASWRKLFKQVYDTLQQYNNDKEFEEDEKKQTTVQYKTTVINEGKEIRISVPPQTKVEAYFYDINLELYFSDYPFGQIQSLSVVKPKLVRTYQAGESRQQRIKNEQVQYLSNVIVEVYEFKQGVAPTKISSFFWVNPKIKVKMNQNQGTLQVFYDGKKQSGCYVKVYSKGAKGSKFYRDGYTDITGTFKYALSDLDEISSFSILTITKQGGVINQINPPQKIAFY